MTAGPARVCFVIPSLAMGGTERQLIYLIRGLSHAYDVDIICTRREGPLAGEARRVTKVRVLDTFGGWDFRIRRRITELFRRKRPEIVHSFLFGFDAPVNAAARDERIPVVISSRRQFATWKEPRHIRHQKNANTMVDCIVANCHAVAQFAAKQEERAVDQYRVIHNGINASEYRSDVDRKLLRRRYTIPFHTDIIGIVANLSPVKDHALFIEIAKELARRRANVHFLMVGNGPLRKRLTRQIAKAGLTDQFTGLTEYAGIADLYRLMDVSVLCSKNEGFPNVVLEAMAAGTPIVAASVGGIPELVANGDFAKLVTTRDPSDFADAIEWVLDHRDETAMTTKRAFAHVDSQYTRKKMVDAYSRLYAELLNNAVRAYRKEP